MSRGDRSALLSALQLAILRVLWSRGEATKSEVHERLVHARAIAPTSIATVLKRLEKRGLVAHRVVGREFVYRALLGEAEVARSMLGEVNERLFAGDLPEMVAQLLRTQDVRPGDIERIRRLLDEQEGSGVPPPRVSP